MLGLLNIRGSDIPYNPVFFAFALITMDQVTLFVNGAKLSATVKNHLGESVQIQPYDQVYQHIKGLKAASASDTVFSCFFNE